VYNLQLDALRVGVADADFDASKLIVSDLQRDDAVDLEILKAALAAGSQCHLLLHPQMNTTSTCMT